MYAFMCFSQWESRAYATTCTCTQPQRSKPCLAHSHDVQVSSIVPSYPGTSLTTRTSRCNALASQACTRRFVDIRLDPVGSCSSSSPNACLRLLVLALGLLGYTLCSLLYVSSLRLAPACPVSNVPYTQYLACPDPVVDAGLCFYHRCLHCALLSKYALSITVHAAPRSFSSNS